MKTKKLLHRLLFPSLIILILFPIISCMVFHYTARQYAVRKAENELAELQTLVMPYVNEAFAAESNLTPKERVSLFVRSAAPAIKRMGGANGDGRILLFAGNYNMVYPREEYEREAVEPLAKACRQYIQETDDEASGYTVQLSSDDGKEYLSRILKVPNDTKEIKYLISYCPVSDIGAWVGAASLRVLLISFAAAVIIILFLIYTAENVNKSIYRLCDETEKIGKGSFAGIDYSFDIAELEQLRLSMNLMSERLKEAENAKNRFYQNISHDLRTPLMSIAGYAQGIETGVFDDPLHAAHIISDESMRLTGLVEGLLNLSRMNAADKPKLVKLDLKEELQDIYEHMNGLAVMSDKQLNMHLADNVGSVLADSESLEQIIENILSNALRYAKKEVSLTAERIDNRERNATGCISVAGVHDAHAESAHIHHKNAHDENKPQGSQCVIIRIVDDGNGIKAEELPHIFERHYKGEEGCFGFGLAIAKAAADRIGATLSAENTEGKGACFTLKVQTDASV